MRIVLNVGPVSTNARTVFTKKTAKSLLSYILRDALIAVQVARRYVRQKRSSIMEIRVVQKQHAPAGVVDNNCGGNRGICTKGTDASVAFCLMTSSSSI